MSALTDANVERIQKAGNKRAREIERSLLEQSDNGLHPGDPKTQPTKSRQLPPRARAARARRSAGGPTADEVIAKFESELGYAEQGGSDGRSGNVTKFGAWYGLDKQPWCATFVSWCFFTTGLPQPASTDKGYAFTPSGAAWYQKQGRWSKKPDRGHVVFFDFPGDDVKRISHVGIVTKVFDDGSIETIEGNTTSDNTGDQRNGGGVYRRRRKTGIVGYGIPAYGDAVDVPPPAPGEKALNEFMAYDASFSGGVFLADARIGGESFVVVGAGQGGGSHVRLLRDDGTEVASVHAFPEKFKGGVHVGAGDVDGDGNDEIVCGAGPGGSPHVIVFKLDGTNLVRQKSFLAWPENMSLGVRAALSPGRVKVAAGPGGGPHTKVFEYAKLP